MKHLARIASLAALLAQLGCDRKAKPGPYDAPPIGPDGDALPSPSAKPSTVSSAPPAPPVCVVAYSTSPPSGAPFFKPGDDLSMAPVPVAVPAGASLTLSVRRTGHEVTITGPAVFRPCTHAEPETVLVADGEASTDRNSNVRPGSDLYLATPGFVAIVGKATLKVRAGIEVSTYDAQDSVTITNLDQTRIVDPGAKGAFKRYEEGGVLITRCGVQVTAVASAASMLSSIAKGTGPPLPAASIGVLTAQQIKHTRQRILDCAFAAGFALACDHWAAIGEKAAGPACKRTSYASLSAHLAVAASVSTPPPGAAVDAGHPPSPAASGSQAGK